MDLENTQNNSLAKHMPTILKQGEYDTWRLRIESYIQLQEYALWEIIEEGNSFKPVARTTINEDGTSTTTTPGAVTAEQKILKKKINLSPKHPDDDTSKFGGNEATKKTQKTLLKQMYETFNASSSESLDSIFNRLQKIISQLTILGEIITPEELNLKFLRSLPTEWGMHLFVVLEEQKSDNGPQVSHSSTNDVNTTNVHVSTGSTPVSTTSTNNSTACLKVQDSSEECVNVEESSSKAMLAIDGTGFDWSYMADEEASTNFALMAFSDSKVQNNKTCSKTCLKNFEDLKSKYDKLRIELNKSESDLDSYKKGLASYKNQLEFYKKKESMLWDQIAVLKRYASFNESDINALKKQVERLKKEKEDNQFKIDNFENASKSLDQLIGNQISDNNKKGLGYNAVPPPLTGLFAPPSIDLSNSGLEKFKQPEFEGYGVKVNKGASENVSKEVKKTSDAPIIEDWVFDCDEDETVVLESLNVQKPKQADQPRKVSQNPRNNNTSWNTLMPKKLGVGFQFTPKACFVCGSFNHLIKDCITMIKMYKKPVLNNVKKGTGQREVRPVWTNVMRVNHQKFSNSRRNFAPTAVLTKFGLVPFSTTRQSYSRTTAPISAARSFNTVVPFVNVAKPRTNAFQKTHSLLRRPFYQQTSLKNRNLNNKVNTAKVESTNSWLVQDQTVSGKDKSNLLIADSLLKTNMATSMLPIIAIISIGYSRANDNCGEDSLKLIELMDLCTKLIDKVTIVEDALKQSKESHAQTLTMGGWKKQKMNERSMTNFKEAKDSEVCKITRADGSSSFHGDIQALLRRLDRQDLSQLYSLVQERFKDHPLEGHDLDLWGDLRMIFDPNEEDDIWLNQQY
ncbi:hypothetical protein Tco_1493212 [Tanacetum coccineum]